MIVFSSRVCNAFPWPRRSRYVNQKDFRWMDKNFFLPACLFHVFTLYGLQKRGCMIPEFNKPNQILWSALQDNTQNASRYTGKQSVVDCLSVFYINNFLCHQRFSFCFLEKKCFCQYCVEGSCCVWVKLWPFFFFFLFFAVKSNGWCFFGSDDVHPCRTASRQTILLDIEYDAFCFVHQILTR